MNSTIKEEKPKNTISKVLEVILTMVSRPSGLIGLIIITLIVILSFSILNGIFGQGDELVIKIKL